MKTAFLVPKFGLMTTGSKIIVAKIKKNNTDFYTRVGDVEGYLLFKNDYLVFIDSILIGSKDRVMGEYLF